MFTSRCSNAGPKEFANFDKRERVFRILQESGIDTSTRNDFRGIGAQFAQNPGECDQSPDPLPPFRHYLFPEILAPRELSICKGKSSALQRCRKIASGLGAI